MSVWSVTRSLAMISIVSAAPLLFPGVAAAQTDPAPRLEAVRTEVAEVMEAIAACSGAQREDAVAEACSAVDQLDAAIAELQRETRDGWAEMTEQAQEDANTRLADLHSAPVDLAQRVRTLQSGVGSAWAELSVAVSAGPDPPAPAE